MRTMWESEDLVPGQMFQYPINREHTHMLGIQQGTGVGMMVMIDTTSGDVSRPLPLTRILAHLNDTRAEPIVKGG